MTGISRRSQTAEAEARAGFFVFIFISWAPQVDPCGLCLVGRCPPPTDETLARKVTADLREEEEGGGKETGFMEMSRVLWSGGGRRRQRRRGEKSNVAAAQLEQVCVRGN